MGELNREIIYAISQMKEFERFLNSDLDCCVLMDMHLALLASMVRAAHERKKKVFFTWICCAVSVRTSMDVSLRVSP